jgi:hypothetical protein
MMLPPSTLSHETAKISRELAMKEIHSNFMKTYKDTNTKLSNNGNGSANQEDGERRSKAYQKIISNAQPSYLDDREAKKQCVR